MSFSLPERIIFLILLAASAYAFWFRFGKVVARIRAAKPDPDFSLQPLGKRVIVGLYNGAPVVAVQWHPEWRTRDNPDSQAFFRLLGRALRGELATSEQNSDPRTPA